MTRAELETLATEKPKELALLFARKVARESGVRLHGGRLKKDGDCDKVIYLPDYLTDWTATIKACEKVGIQWEKVGGNFWAYVEGAWRAGKSCTQRSNWPDCAALMIVTIEMLEEQK